MRINFSSFNVRASIALGTSGVVRGAALMCVLSVLGVSSAAAQSNPPSAGNPPSGICYPGADLTCSPKIETRMAVPATNKTVTWFRRSGQPVPPNSENIQFVNVAVEQDGNGTSEFIYQTPIEFTAQAASLTVNASYIGLGRKVGPAGGNACERMVFEIKKGNTVVGNEPIGQTCSTEHQTLFRSFTLNGLEPGATYRLTPKASCDYNGMNQAGNSFVCTFAQVSATLVWPFGNR